MNAMKTSQYHVELVLRVFSKKIEDSIGAYQRELIDTHYQEVENMYKKMRGWRHDYRNHIQMMKALAINGDMDGIDRIDKINNLERKDAIISWQ